MNRSIRECGKSAASLPPISSRSKAFGNSEDSSASHRRKLEALFQNQNPTPETTVDPASRNTENAREGKIFSSPRKSLGRSPSDFRLRLERLRIAREPEEIKEATDIFLQYHQLPDDIDILYKVMQHPTEKVVREALGQISSLLIQGRISGGMLLEDRLQQLSERAKEDATHAYIEGLRTQLAKMKEI